MNETLIWLFDGYTIGSLILTIVGIWAALCFITLVPLAIYCMDKRDWRQFLPLIYFVILIILLFSTTWWVKPLIKYNTDCNYMSALVPYTTKDQTTGNIELNLSICRYRPVNGEWGEWVIEGHTKK